MNRTFLFLGLSVALLASAASAGSDWLTDLKKARSKAEKSGKPILVSFDGSDW